MYTTVFYKADTLELVATEESGTMPEIHESKYDYYVQVGVFDPAVDVVDPSRGVESRTKEQLLEVENAELKTRVESLEMAMDFVMEL